MGGSPGESEEGEGPGMTERTTTGKVGRRWDDCEEETPEPDASSTHGT